MAKEVTEKLVEETADALDIIADEVEQVAEAVRSTDQIKLYAFLWGASTGLIVGGFTAYKIASKRLELKYSKIADEEIDQMREHFAKRDQVRNAEAAKLTYVPPEVEVVDPRDNNGQPVNIVKNVFENHADAPAWNYAEELKNRSSNAPYIIHKDEYDANETEREQTTITYYAGDDVLADERDGVLDQKDEMVGEDNLLKFGHGSEDPNVLFVRNERLDMDFEIVRSDGSYAKEVHGLEDEDTLTHMDKRHRLRRFDDDTVT